MTPVPLKKLDAKSYHVAWICAVADLELTPARLLLDETHERPDIDYRYDDNIYRFGTMAGHNVVMAACPEAMPGQVNISSIAGPLSRTFPAIKLALLVGIGGGVPQKHQFSQPLKDVRLGDVVVGWPSYSDGKPAVVYYDSGMSLVNGFQTTAQLNRPDHVLLMALAMLKSDHDMGESNFQFHLDRLQQHESLGHRFRHPGIKHDMLFNSSYEHVGEYNYYCANCDKANLVDRKPREEGQKDKFVFHQGRIATGNSVIQDGKKRDSINDQLGNVFCIDTEAAGVDINGNCFVIRGISDYADSHKNDMWRSYAAGKAVVFARELLDKISPTDIKVNMASGNKHWLVNRPTNPHFTGRRQVIVKIIKRITSEDAENEQKRFVLTGMGGQGKSEICLHVANEVRDRFWGIFWVDVSRRKTAEENFSEVAEALGCPKTVDAARKTLSNLPHTSRWLLILDNADDPHRDYQVYIPSGNRGTILITSRNPRCGLLATAGDHEELDGLEERECVQLLQKTAQLPHIAYDSEDYTIAATLVKHLGHHTQAIFHAGSYIAIQHCSIADYLAFFRTNRRRLLETSRGQGISRYDTVYATFAASIEFLELSETGSSEETRKDALKLLDLLSTFNYMSIPLDVLEDACEGAVRALKTPEELETYSGTLTAWHVAQAPDFVTTEKDGVRFRISKAVERLESLALVRTDRSATAWKSVSMHPLVHGWLGDRQSQQERKEALRRTECLVALSAFSSHSWRPCYNQFGAHLTRLVESDVELVDDAAQSRCVLQACVQIAWTYHRVGLQKDMYKFTDRIFQRLGLRYQEPTEELREVYRLFALAVHGEGNLPARALQTFEAVARLDEKTRGKNGKEQLDRARDLGNVYDDNARTKRATPLLAGVFKARQELGEVHEELLLSQHDFAIALSNDSRSERFIALLQSVVDISAGLLPADNPDLLLSKQVLAVAYLRNRQVAEATALLEDVVRLEAQSLGEEGPSTAKTRTCLADAYMEAGRLSEAIVLYEQVANNQTLVFGDKHPSLLTSHHRLAAAYEKAGRAFEAGELFERAINVQILVLGRKYTHAIEEEHNLAKKYLEAGRVSEAFKILEKLQETGSSLSDDEDNGHERPTEIPDYASSHSSGSIKSGPESVFSDLRTEFDTASSVSSQQLSLSIAARVVKALYKDDQLERLFNETKTRTDRDKFERNFDRLFRVFLWNLTKEVAGSQILEYSTVIRRVRHDRRKIASAMADQLFGPAVSGERMKVPNNEPVNSDARINEFLLSMRPAEGYSDTGPSPGRGRLVNSIHEDANEGNDANESDHGKDDSDSGDSDDEQRREAEQQLHHLESLFLNSEALQIFRIKYESFLFPNRPSITREHDSHAASISLLETLQTENYLDLIMLWPIPREPQGPGIHQIFIIGWMSFLEHSHSRAMRLLHRMCTFLSWTKQASYHVLVHISGFNLISNVPLGGAMANLSTIVKHFIRPSLKEGYERIEWTCECGDKLYQDYPKCDQSNIDHAKSFVALHGNNSMAGPSYIPPAHLASPNQSGSATSSQAVTNATAHPSSSGQTLATAPSSSHTPVGSPGQRRKMFLELCVNTGRHQVSLGEIPFRMNQEAEFFANVQARYKHLRGFRRHFFLLKVTHVQYIRFNLGGHVKVGVLDSPLALPSDEELVAYRYGPLPMARPTPVPENDFLHRFHKDDHRHHTFQVHELPHKLNESITTNPNPRIRQHGWGVYLIEGTDIFMVGCVTVASALLSLFVAFTWWGVTNDAQTAFTVASFLVATQGMVLGGTVLVLEHM